MQIKINNLSSTVKIIYRNLIRNDTKLSLIKKIYFPDSVESRTQNNYSYLTNDKNNGDLTFYLVFQHDDNTNDSMIITLHWFSDIPLINIFITKDRVIVSKNALINESSLRTIFIPNNVKGKKLYFWLFIINNTLNIIFSGLSYEVSVLHDGIKDLNEEFNIIYVSDSPFTIQRGLITKNIYNLSSDAYGDIKEYEKSQGTIV